MRVLFLTPRYPYPPRKGDQLRAHHTIHALRGSHQVTVLSYAPRVPPPEDVGDEDIRTAPLSPWAATFGVARAAASGAPFQVGLYTTRAMGDLVARLLPEHDVVHLNTVRMAGNIQENCRLPIVVDFVDALSLNTRRYGNAAAPPKRWVLREEARRLKRYEARLASRAAFACAVSQHDANELGPGVSVVRHGVDTTRYSPHGPGTARTGIVFTGNLAYPPNHAAAMETITEIFPRVRERTPGARLRVVGVNPSPALARAAGEGVEVVGPVEDMAAELRRAAVAIAPIRFGGGVQTKILEALACGAAVVATPFANEGIGALNGDAISLGESPSSLARAVSDLLVDDDARIAMSRSGRTFVEARFSIGTALAPLLAWYERYR